jgi:hypothetical protein
MKPFTLQTREMRMRTVGLSWSCSARNTCDIDGLNVYDVVVQYVSMISDVHIGEVGRSKPKPPGRRLGWIRGEALILYIVMTGKTTTIYTATRQLTTTRTTAPLISLRPISDVRVILTTTYNRPAV